MQEEFARLLFKNVSQHDAWGRAGYSTNYSDNAIDVNASRLANSAKVKLRVAELRNLAATPDIADVTERQKILTKIVRTSYAEPVKASDVVNSISELNKMTGVYATASTVSIDNRSVNIYTRDKRVSKALGKIGERAQIEEPKEE